MRVGIPNALYFEGSNLMYKTFFNELGIDVIFSGVTTNKIKEEGIRISTSESCLASKIFIGHVDSLVKRSKKENIDYIFVPRLCTYKKNETECVKFYAMYDICKNLFDGNFITLNLDYDRGKSEITSYVELANKLGINPLKAYIAYIKAKRVCKLEKEATEKYFFKTNTNERKKILVVAHPYVFEDNLLGKPICNFIKSQGIGVVYASKQKMSNKYKDITKTLYWRGSKKLVSGVLSTLEGVDGIIYISVFPCGGDSLVTELMQRKIKNIPSISLVLDEHTNLEGYITRLESFVDIINKDTFNVIQDVM